MKHRVEVGLASEKVSVRRPKCTKKPVEQGLQERGKCYAVGGANW